MLRIALLNMPIAATTFASLGLTQLRAAVLRQFSGRVEVRTHYLNQDFAELLGLDIADAIVSMPSLVDCHFGEWLFRQAAFPHLPDNREPFVATYHHELGGEAAKGLLARLIEDRPRYDAFLEQMIERYQLDHYDVVGFTLLSMQTVASLAMARKLKEHNPNVLTVFGGPSCDAPMGHALVKNVQAVDFAFAGAATKTFCQFVGHLLDRDEQPCHDIEGVISRQKIACCGAACRDETGRDLDIDDLLELDYSEFRQSLQRRGKAFEQPVVLLETSRGCRWAEKSQCRFCGYSTTRAQYHAMRPDVAHQQLQQLVRDNPGPIAFYLTDAAMPSAYVTSLLPRLKLPKGVTLSCFVRPVLGEPQLRTMADAGVTTIGAGIEAMATSTLRLMRKSTNAFQNVAFLKACAALGRIHYTWDIIIGCIGEEEAVYEKYMQDLPLMVHLPPPRRILPLYYYRYSPYSREPDRYGLKLRPHPSYGLIYPFPKRELEDLAYYFEDAAVDPARRRCLEAWRQRLSSLLTTWQALWRRRHGGPPPELTARRRNGQTVIYDTRSGSAVERIIHPLATRILKLLDRPRTTAQLRLAGLGASEQRLKQEIAILDEWGLLFVEGARYMSLVVWPSDVNIASEPSHDDAASRDGDERPAEEPVECHSP